MHEAEQTVDKKQHILHELSGRAGALGVEGLPSVIDSLDDPVKLRAALTALYLVEQLQRPDFDDIQDRTLLAHVAAGRSDDQDQQALADGFYELVGSTRPNTQTEEPDESNANGTRSFWRRPTTIPGVAILEARVTNDGSAPSFYVNLSRSKPGQ